MKSVTNENQNHNDHFTPTSMTKIKKKTEATATECKKTEPQQTSEMYNNAAPPEKFGSPWKFK